MRITRLLSCLLVLMLLTIAGGCGVVDWIFPDDEDIGENGNYYDIPGGEEGDEDAGAGFGRETVLYVADNQARYVVPVTLAIPWETGIARAAVGHLVEGGPAQQQLEQRGLRALLPAGTTVLGISINDGRCIVDFSRELLNTADPVQEKMMLESLVWTLTEFDTIDEVVIWVEGRPVTKLTHGTPVPEVLNRESGVNAEDATAGTTVLVWLRLDSMAGGRLLVPVTRSAAKGNLAAAALDELIKGPRSGTALSHAVPATTQVQQLEVLGDTVTVDFSADLSHADDLALAVSAVVLTLTDLENIDKVIITIDGEGVRLPNGEELSQPVMRPSGTNPLGF